MESVYHTSRTRPATWVPRRVYYVLAYLKRQLAPNTPKAISNKHIQIAIRFGSEGEVSQIMRWLAGEMPTMGRWAYGVLQTTEQRYRFIERERMPSGGYLIRLLPHPQPIAPPPIAEPQIVQLSFLDDPSVIPPAPQQDASDRGSFSTMAHDRGDRPHLARANRRSQRDHHEEIHEDSDQEEEESRTPLFDRLMAQPGMNRRLAQQIANAPIGTLADFETDLKIAATFARTSFWFTVASWRDGQRVVAPEEPRHEQPARSRTSARRTRAQTHPTGRSAPDQVATDYAVLLAEIAACNPGMSV